MKKIEIPEEKLRELYLEKYYSQSMCAEYFNTSVSSIRRKLNEYDIKQDKEMISKKKSLSQSLNLNLTKDELVEMYINRNMSSKELCDKYNVSRSYLMRLLRSYGIKKPKDLEVANRNKTMFERYGVMYSFQSEEIKEKSRKTLRDKYGVENISQVSEIKEKKKQTNLRKYGVENVWSKGSPILDKVKETNYERYGTNNPYSSDIVKEKIRQTNLERYGVEWYCETEHAKSNNKQYKVSKVNRDFSDNLNSKNIKNELEYYINNNSFDLKVDNTVVEINPTYTHNSTFDAILSHTILKAKPKDYHLNKTKLANEHNLHCIHIFDWDDKDKIVNLLLPKTQLYARKCELKEVSIKDANDFLNLYHLQGSLMKQEVCLGLYYNNELIELMTFGKPRYNKNYEYELLRLCTHKDYRVTGGTQRLFKYFVDNFKPESIISYCDISKFSGEVYDKLGFTLKSTSKPARHWYNIKTGKHITDNLLRQRGFDQLFGTNYGKGTSNDLLMLEHGFVEVYDCGQSTYTWNKKDFK